jgi:hypothetical protein
MLDIYTINQLDDLASSFEEAGDIKTAAKLDVITQILSTANKDLSDHVNKLTDMLCGYLKIDPEEAISISADLVEKYGLKDELIKEEDSEVEGTELGIGLPTNIFPIGALPQKERRQGPDANLVDINNPAWWEPRQGNVENTVKVIRDLEQYSDKLKQAGYKKQSKKIGMLVSQLMLGLDYYNDNFTKCSSIKKGMFLQDTSKNLIGEVTDVDFDGENVKISLFDTNTGSSGGIVMGVNDSVRVLKMSKPLQKEALIKKASILLDDLITELDGNESSLQLSRIKYFLEH